MRLWKRMDMVMVVLALSAHLGLLAGCAGQSTPTAGYDHHKLRSDIPDNCKEFLNSKKLTHLDSVPSERLLECEPYIMDSIDDMDPVFLEMAAVVAEAVEDYPSAYRWGQKAAAAGRPKAQVLLSRLYYSGNGVAQDQRQALVWAEKAAHQGDADALALMGVMYGLGQGGVQPNIAYSLIFLKLAAAAGNPEAVKSVVNLSRDMDPDLLQKIENTTQAMAAYFNLKYP